MSVSRYPHVCIYPSVNHSRYRSSYTSISLTLYTSVCISTGLTPYISTCLTACGYNRSYSCIRLPHCLHLSLSLHVCLIFDASSCLTTSLSLHLSVSLSMHLSYSQSTFVGLTTSVSLSMRHRSTYRKTTRQRWTET